MRGKLVDDKTKLSIGTLRKEGLSINEISAKVGRSKSIVSRYIQGVAIEEPFLSILRSKQGASRTRSEKNWAYSKIEAKNAIGILNNRDLLLLLAGVYWGEGTKKEANIINGDVHLLKIFVRGLLVLGLKKEDFKVSVRLFDGINKMKAKMYWLKELDLPTSVFVGFDIVKGEKRGKLVHGMCRIRVKKGDYYFKFIMSLIEEIKLQTCLRSSMDRIAHS